MNQLLEFISEKYSAEEIRKNKYLNSLWDKLLEIKVKTINGGKVLITNTREIMSRMQPNA
ncbi:MAG: hypothetical protein ACOCX8_00340 [Bacteroidota bacterium]